MMIHAPARDPRTPSDRSDPRSLLRAESGLRDSTTLYTYVRSERIHNESFVDPLYCRNTEKAFGYKQVQAFRRRTRLVSHISRLEEIAVVG
jgi:hypothetical protein